MICGSGMKRDSKLVRSVAKGMSPRDRRRFGEFIHKQKKLEHRPKGKKGDYSYQELKQLRDKFEGK